MSDPIVFCECSDCGCKWEEYEVRRDDAYVCPRPTCCSQDVIFEAVEDEEDDE